MSRLAVAVAIALGVGGCSGDAGKGKDQAAMNDVHRPAPGTAADVETSTPIEANDAAAAKASTPAPPTACIPIGEAEARALSGLELMGRSGSTSIYARPRELSCSEPGPVGHGECELVGRTAVRLESPSGTYGFRSTVDVPAVLVYSPDGFECRELRVPPTRGRGR